MSDESSDGNYIKIDKSYLKGAGVGAMVGIPLLAGAIYLFQPAPAAKIPQADVPAQTTTGRPTAQVEKDLKIKGNRSSRIYHLPGCASYDRISERNIVWFKTTEEAASAGYRMAKNC
jgi:Adenosine deaminase